MNEQDKFVEKVVVHNGFVNEKQMEKAKKVHVANPDKTLLQILMAVKLITKEQAKSVLKLYEKKRLNLKKSVNQSEEKSPIDGGPVLLDHAPPQKPQQNTEEPVITFSQDVNIAAFKTMDEYFSYARNRQASDLHINTDCHPTIRLHGSLIELQRNRFSAAEAHQLLFSILTPEQRQDIEDEKALDFCYVDKQKNRYRVCIVKQRTGWNGAFRIIRKTPPTCEELGLPANLKDLVEYHQGLILVTGPKGSGKTTTLAALVNLINQQREDHIITIEDPIEYTFTPQASQINQRQVKEHTKSFSSALRAALREDPDIIMIGELRDLETTSLAISASETGHLVFATLHTTSAAKTIDQIIDVFPPDQQNQIRSMISESIKGIVCQQLLPRKDGKGRALALEVMLNNNAVANLIRERKIFQLNSIIQMNKRQGMTTMDNSLHELVTKEIVDGHSAYYAAEDKSRFQEWAPKK